MESLVVGAMTVRRSARNGARGGKTRHRSDPSHLPLALYHAQLQISRQHGLRRPKRRVTDLHWGCWCWLCQHELYHCVCPLDRMEDWYAK